MRFYCCQVYIQYFKQLPSFCNLADWFVPDLAGNPAYRFFRDNDFIVFIENSNLMRLLMGNCLMSRADNICVQTYQHLH